MKNTYIYTIIICSLIAASLLLIKKKSKINSIKINMVVIENADTDFQIFGTSDISVLYYNKDKIIEEINENEYKKYTILNDNSFHEFTTFDSIGLLPSKNINEKKQGYIKLNSIYLDNAREEQLNDTTLNNVHLKRISYITNEEYIIFYLSHNIHLPISYYKKVEDKFNGTIRRIDAYQKKHDKFITIKININDSIPKHVYNYLN